MIPFYENVPLHNIAAGGVASPNVNLDEAEEFGSNYYCCLNGRQKCL